MAFDDPFRALGAMPSAARARLLFIDANPGLPRPDAHLLEPSSGGAPLPSRGRRLTGVVQRFDDRELQWHLVEAQHRVLDNAPTDDGAGTVLARSSASLDVTADLVRDDRWIFPVLPWSASGPRASALPGHFEVTASTRSMLYRCPTGSVVVKVEPAPDARPEPRGHRMWRWARARAIETVFGVSRGFDGFAVRRVDILQSLASSQRVEAAIGDIGAAVLPERVGAVGPDGGVIFRDPRPFPPGSGDSILVPLVALVGDRGRAPIDLLADLARATGTRPSELAYRVGSRYLAAWHHLWFHHGILQLQPHAQNGHIELDADNRLGRIVLQDMRDVDCWSAYRSMSSRDTRLIGVDRHYLFFEMVAHPLYHDARHWRDPHARLASAAFNFAFQMLRNHVLRNLVIALGLATEEAMVLNRGFAAALADLAASGSVPSQLPITRVAASRVERSAGRRLRDEWLGRSRAQPLVGGAS